MSVWDFPEWPSTSWDGHVLATPLARVCREQGRLLGRLEALDSDLRREAHLRTLTEDVLHSAALEGGTLEREQVRSSIARRLGLHEARGISVDRSVDGIVEMMHDATIHPAKPLTRQRLFSWHAALFPTGFCSGIRIVAGNWRDERSGLAQVPPAERIPDEMTRFLRWFAEPGEMDPLLVSGLTHVWFATLQPFAAGNGPIARALADMALARSEQVGQRFYSMSLQISREPEAYNAALEQVRAGTLDITRWLEWFLGCALRAVDGARETLGSVLIKANFWERFARAPLNERQVKGMNFVLDGLDDKLTTSTWATLTRCSQDTAHRDIVDLVARGALRQGPGAGRSTSYSLRLE